MAIVTAPVSISNVKSALGSNSNDLASLCVHTNINKWSKYKPVRLSSVDTITGQWDSANNRWLSSATWWKGQAKTGARRPQYTCGLAINCYDNDRDAFKSAIDNGNGGWTYEKPTGGASSPYRLQDFAGYISTAAPMIEQCFCPSKVAPNQNFSITILANAQSSRSTLGLNDIFPNSPSNKVWYFGVICYNGTTKLGEITSKVPIGQDAELVDNVTHSWGEIKLTAPSSTGTYKLYPCIMYASNYANNPSGSMTNTQTPPTQTFVALPLPAFAPITVEVTPQTETKEWMSGYAVLRLYYTDFNFSTIDWSKSLIDINITSTAGKSVGSVSRTNTITIMLGNITFSGFTTQTDSFTYSGTSNNPHSYSKQLTYTAFGSGTNIEKRQNFSTVIEQAERGNAYIYINQGNGNNLSSPIKSAITIQRYVEI